MKPTRQFGDMEYRRSMVIADQSRMARTPDADFGIYATAFSPRITCRIDSARMAV